MTQINNDKLVNLVSYFFSNYGHEDIYPNLGIADAVQTVADKLDVKKSVILNRRDFFDAHRKNSNHSDKRTGWTDIPMPDNLLQFKTEYDLKSKDEIIAELKAILE